MNRLDSIHAEPSGSPELVYPDHQKLKDGIWEVYSEELKAAQDQDILLPPTSSRGPSFGSSQPLSVTSEAGQGESVARVFNVEPDSNLSNKKLEQVMKTNSTTEMAGNIYRKSVSPQLSAILDFVIGMEQNQEAMEVSPSSTATEMAEENKICDIDISTITPGKELVSQKQTNIAETNERLDVNQTISNYQNINQNYGNIRSFRQSNDEYEQMRSPAKRLRLPGIEQVINKTSFANQISGYYNRKAYDGNGVAYGTEIAQQQFINQQVMKPQIRQVMPASCKISPRENVRFSSPKSSIERSTISGQPILQESYTQSNERPMTDSQAPHNGQLLNPSVSKSGSWPFANLSLRETPPLASPQFQNNIVPQREARGTLELGIPRADLNNPSVNNMSLNRNINEHLKYKINSPGGSCLVVQGNTASPRMENEFPSNAMVTRSDPSYPLYFNNRSTQLKENDYQKNLQYPSCGSLISPTVPPPNLNQTPIHLSNINAPKIGQHSMTPNQAYQSKKILPSYSTINSQSIKRSPTTPPNLSTNTNTLTGEFSQQSVHVVSPQGHQYSTSSSKPVQGEFNQCSSGQSLPNAANANLKSLNLNEMQLKFPINKKSQWSGLYGDSTASGKGLQGFPAPIPSCREFSSPSTQDLPSFRSQDLPSTSHQQNTPPIAQQFPSFSAQDFPYACNQQFQPQNPTSTQEFPSPPGQCGAIRPELHSMKFPHSIPAPSTSAKDLQLLNLTGTNQIGQHDVSQAKNYSQPSTTKTPKKRRATKGPSVAQTKRIQKKRKEVQEKLFQFLRNKQCTHETSVIITKHLYHVQNCPHWLPGENCLLCHQIFEMVMHSTECLSLNCPFLYCSFRALSAVAETFTDPNFVYRFLTPLNISEEEMKDVNVLKDWNGNLTPE